LVINPPKSTMGPRCTFMTQWKGSVTRRGGMTTSSEREAAPRREKGGDDASWTVADLIGPKNKIKSTRSIQLL
jgi:hypothetical protein